MSELDLGASATPATTTGTTTAAAQGIVTMYPVGAPPVEVVLDETRDGARICAIAMLENQEGELVVRREVSYLDGAQRALDQAYGWGMNWTRGRK